MDHISPANKRMTFIELGQYPAVCTILRDFSRCVRTRCPQVRGLIGLAFGAAADKMSEPSGTLDIRHGHHTVHLGSDILGATPDGGRVTCSYGRGKLII